MDHFPVTPDLTMRRDREPVSRPSLLDQLFLLGGMALTLYLLTLTPMTAHITQRLPDERLVEVVEFLPTRARIPEGMILVWPLFFLTQWRSRDKGLTSGEWLWIFAWVGIALLTALTAWQHLAGLPEWLEPHAAKPRLLWYMILVPALSLLALILALLDVFRTAPTPWTHSMGLALMIWPGPIMAGILACGRVAE